MRGGSLTRFRPDDQSGSGVRVGDFVSLVKRSTQGGLKGGWERFKKREVRWDSLTFQAAFVEPRKESRGE